MWNSIDDNIKETNHRNVFKQKIKGQFSRILYNWNSLLLKVLETVSIHYFGVCLSACLCVYKKQLPNVFEQHFRYARDVHTQHKVCFQLRLPQARFRTNIGKQTVKAIAIDWWQNY